MAAPETDIGQLSDEHQLALEQYTAVTAQDVPAAIALLERSQWNVQVSGENAASLWLCSTSTYIC
jgi:FAS-associated factor 2